MANAGSLPEGCTCGTCVHAGVVGGGYADDLGVLAERHMLLHKAALAMWRGYGL